MSPPVFLWACRGPFPVAAQVSHVHPTHFPKFQIITEHPSPLQKQNNKNKECDTNNCFIKRKIQQIFICNPPPQRGIYIGWDLKNIVGLHWGMRHYDIYKEKRKLLHLYPVPPVQEIWYEEIWFPMSLFHTAWKWGQTLTNLIENPSYKFVSPFYPARNHFFWSHLKVIGSCNYLIHVWRMNYMFMGSVKTKPQIFML